MITVFQFLGSDRGEALIYAPRAVGERLCQLFGCHVRAKMQQAATLQFEDELRQFVFEIDRDVPDDVIAPPEYFGVQLDQVRRGMGDAAEIAVTDVDDLSQNLERIASLGPPLSPGGKSGGETQFIAKPDNRAKDFRLIAEIEIKRTPGKITGFGKLLHGQIAIAMGKESLLHPQQHRGRRLKLLLRHSCNPLAIRLSVLERRPERRCPKEHRGSSGCRKLALPTCRATSDSVQDCDMKFPASAPSLRNLPIFQRISGRGGAISLVPHSSAFGSENTW